MKKVILLGVLIISNSFIFAQSEAIVKVNGVETSVIVPEAEEYVIEFPIIPEAAGKAWTSPVTNFLDCDIYIEGDEKLNLENLYKSGGKIDGYRSWKKAAKANEKLIVTVDGGRINYALDRLQDNGWPDQDVKIKIWAEAMADLKGATTILSEVYLTIPLTLRSKFREKENQDIYSFFKSGGASNNINNKAFANTVESYIEQKWPSNDVTTVNLRSLKSQNYQNTEFKFEGYYIKKEDGVCEYNSFYGNSNIYNGNYSITFFNSMNLDKPIQCATAELLRNR